MPLGAHKATLFGVAGVSTASVVLLSTQTASDSANLDFTSGIDSTYGEYIFKFYNINPANDSVDLSFQVNATDDPGGGYDTSLITSTAFQAYHQEDDGAAALSYQTGLDQAQGSGYQQLMYYMGNGSDESGAGVLHLFNPSSTTYVKHFYSRCQVTLSGGRSDDDFIAGYINDTTAIDEISFKMSSGNFDGVIQMYGIA